MDRKHTAESQAADALLNEQISEDVTSAPGPLEADDLRRKRVDEYEIAGLEKPDPLAACLTTVNADLMHLSFEIGKALKQSLAAELATVESVRRVEPALNSFLRIARQIERIAQLEVREAEAWQEAASAKTRLQTMALQGHARDATSRSARPISSPW